MSSSHPPTACHLFVCHYNSCCHVIQLKSILMHFPVNQRGVRYTSCVSAFKSKTTKQSYQPRCENSFLTSTSDIYRAGCTCSCVASIRQKNLNWALLNSCSHVQRFSLFSVCHISKTRFNVICSKKTDAGSAFIAVRKEIIISCLILIRWLVNYFRV